MGNALVVVVKGINGGKRSVVIPAFLWQRRQQKRKAKFLQRKLRWQINRNIYGFVRGRGLHRLLFKISQWRYEGLCILKMDIRQAYRNVNLNRLEKLLKKSNEKGPLHYRFIDSRGEKIHIRGLAEGLNTSPIYLAVYLSPVLYRISQRYRAAIYGDDLFIALNTPQEKAQAVNWVQNALYKNQNKGKRK